MSQSDLSNYNDVMVVPKQEVVRFISETLQSLGLSREVGDSVGHSLMYADYRGIFNHGIFILDEFIKDFKKGLIDGNAEPTILHDFQAIALVDGCNNFGSVVGKYCMRMAIEKAHRFGIGFVCARGSNHYGISGYYTRMAMERGMIGLSCSNASPLMVPPNGAARGVGSNPLSFAMAATGGDQFILDMASTTAGLCKIKLAEAQGKKIPEGWAINERGKSLTDPREALKSRMLLPLADYKGFGIALMVELFCGILSDSDVGPQIRDWTSHDRVANLGQAFIAIYPDVFAPGSRNRLAHLLSHLRDLPHKGDKPVIVPGDMQKMNMDKVDKEGGIHYIKEIMEKSFRIAQEVGIEPMVFTKKKLVFLS